MQASPARRLNAKRAIALLLTFAAGCVDIVGYLTLYHAFTAHMTGETVHLAENLLQGHRFDAAVAGCVIAAFLAGSIVGRSIIEIGWRRHLRSIASAALALEAGLLGAVIPLARAPRSDMASLGLLAMLAAAMGLQTATLTRIGSLTVHTTFVTGMLNKLAQLLSHGLFLRYDLGRGRDVRTLRRKVLRETCFIFSVWALYFFGAVTGASIRARWGAASLLLPAALVVVAILEDQRQPLSIEEEQDQPQP